MASATVALSPPITITEPSITSKQFQAQRFVSTHRDLSLKSFKNLQDIKLLHGRLTKQGLVHDTDTLTQLITKYTQMGSFESLEYADKAFTIFKDSIENESSCNNNTVAYLYNSLIRGKVLVGSIHEAVLVYVDMVTDGVQPDNYTFPIALSAFAKRLNLCEGAQLHGSIVKSGFERDVFVLNSLIHFYGVCGEIDKGRKVFDEMPERNVVSWTSLICGYTSKGRHREAIALFFDMVEEDIKPNEITLTSVISACAKLGDLYSGEKVLNCAKRLGVTVNDVLVNAIVDMYMKCGAADKARDMFDECVDRDSVLYNTLMSNYVKLGRGKEAVEVFSQMMLNAGPKPDRVTMLSVITSAAELGDLGLGKQCHSYVLRNRLECLDSSIGNSIIDMYSKCGKQDLACALFKHMSHKTVVSWNALLAGFARSGYMDKAREIFDDIPEKNLVSWNTMIGALSQNSLFNEAIELFHSMQREGIAPDEVTMASVASACGYLGALDLAKWTYDYIERYKIPCNVRLSTAVIDMFARCGDPQSAMRVFSKMKTKDVSSYTAAIGAMSMEGNGEGAIELFHEMLSQGITPDEVVFSGVLTACSHKGLVKEGMRVFDSMEEHGITPNVVHYGCVVDLLVRAGLLHEAVEFINSMPMEPNGAIWAAFLAGCRVHKNEKLATLAADTIAKSGSDKTGIQVLLSNIYACARKWDDVAKVRLHMKEKGMKKIPGSSSIEVNGVVHEFTSGDESHLENSIVITSMLHEISRRLRDEGYLPDLTNVLLDIDESEKEFMLIRHSEKLAISFGLVSLSRGTAVRIVKNLRMCSDCHSFAKMVSKVYDREIVVRDTNRFHFFKRGLCSCGDYW